MKTGFVVSDLHLFTRWTRAKKYLPAMSRAAADADFCVLNGDIFDFRWTTLPSIADTVEAAGEWLRSFAQSHPACQFYYVMGNHDGFDFFAEHLDGMVGGVENLNWHPSHVRIGNALFLHGDLVLHGPMKDPFARPLTRKLRKESDGMISVYHLMHRMRLQRMVAPLMKKKWCVDRLAQSFELARPHITGGVTDIYFGHTHLQFSGLRHKGYTFHNSGAVTHGFTWNPMKVPLKYFHRSEHKAAGD